MLSCRRYRLSDISSQQAENLFSRSEHPLRKSWRAGTFEQNRKTVLFNSLTRTINHNVVRTVVVVFYTQWIGHVKFLHCPKRSRSCDTTSRTDCRNSLHESTCCVIIIVVDCQRGSLYPCDSSFLSKCRGFHNFRPQHGIRHGSKQSRSSLRKRHVYDEKSKIDIRYHLRAKED